MKSHTQSREPPPRFVSEGEFELWDGAVSFAAAIGMKSDPAISSPTWILDIETEDNIARGLSLEKTQYAAQRKLGNTTLIREEFYRMNSVEFLESISKDARSILRMLCRNPGFATVVILTLALGIGMNATVFSVVNAVLLHPLAYPNADRLVWLTNYDEYFKQDNWGSRADYVIWKDQTHSFESMTAYGNQDPAHVSGGEASQERIASITGDFWSIVGAQPGLGRLFRPGEPNAMVLSYRLFERRFGSAPQVIGRLVTVNCHPFTVAGVLPKDFRFPFPQQWWAGKEKA
jgi:hypothetical protein